MNRVKQSAAITICLLGLAVLAVGGVFLVREWRAEVAARKSLEQETARLKAEIEELKARNQLRVWTWSSDPSFHRSLKREELAIEPQRAEGDGNQPP